MRRKSETAAVIVTYGSRADLCLNAIDAALRAGVGKAVVIINGSPPESRSRLETFQSARPKEIQLVCLASNEGSASGFGEGMSKALSDPDVSSLWLLDDDNQPRADALEVLLDTRERMAAEMPAESVLLMSYRPARTIQRSIVEGTGVSRAFPSRGSFADFNVIDIAYKVVRRVFGSLATKHPVGKGDEVYELPYGAYGGLLVPRGVVERCGLPDKAFTTYEDDADYTRRLVTAGSQLYLVGRSIIADVEQSWYSETRGNTPFTRRLLASSDLRVYLATRNRIVFECRYWRGNELLYRVNRVAFLGGLALAAAFTRRRVRHRLILRAVRDGETGHLGPVSLGL